MRYLTLTILAYTSVGVCPIVGADERAAKTEIETAIKQLAKEATSSRFENITGRGAEGQFAKPAVCGKTFTPAQMLADGALVATHGTVSVKDPAAEGSHKFYLWVRIIDQNGEVVRQTVSRANLNKGGTTDIGYFERIRRCYCDATTLKVELALSSVAPDDTYILHQYEACEFYVRP